ncbi:hypothetical protein PPL_01506 [Heterostelium album PN500]|uniref:Uncharacterized protein n=1 Tax=Heterostelium pallidum (strain ATCC 26659 / Pp 5 / PN500) TaxID=670386 RepID=D3AZG5_HETP5|nr:hypothetical protein PPL_01506 [Heterostelium album PN500]EFA85548.1 hypothetical protein PPL_01506 [Heterostelium album PN500]|eukprot:XP_020437656.1 hypothetical protein PPL_01506 [Heterostelium album PN500]
MVLYLLVNLGNPAGSLKAQCGVNSTIAIPVRLDSGVSGCVSSPSINATADISGTQGDIFTQIQDINGRFQ